jgi:hypothetical protein
MDQKDPASTVRRPLDRTLDASAGSDIPHLVIIVPGIRDRGGDWNVVCHELEKAGFSATIAGWSEFFSLPRFLVPAPWFRRIAMQSLLKRITNSIQAYTVNGQLPRVSYIGHSFGSYILCYLLRKQSSLKAHRLILCGSVLGRDFGFSSFETRFEGQVLNDVGKKDDYPYWASCVTFGYGTVGTYGYVGEPVRDRFHEGVGHGDFSRQGFCTRWWVPYLLTEGRDGILLPENNAPKREGAILKTCRRLLQNLKWIITAGITWIAIAMPLDQHCANELESLGASTKIDWTGESQRLVELGAALGRANERMKEETGHFCTRVPRLWPFATRWPDSHPVVMYHGADFLKLKACRARDDEPGLNRSLEAAVSGAEVLGIIVSQFSRCMLSVRGQDGLEISLWKRGSGELPSGVQRLDLNEKGQYPGQRRSNTWYLCQCDNRDLDEFRRMRGAL